MSYNNYNNYKSNKFNSKLNIDSMNRNSYMNRNTKNQFIKNKSILKYSTIRKYLLELLSLNKLLKLSDISRELNFDENQLNQFMSNKYPWPKGLLSKFIEYINENDDLLGLPTLQIREYFEKNHPKKVTVVKTYIYKEENVDDNNIEYENKDANDSDDSDNDDDNKTTFILDNDDIKYKETIHKEDCKEITNQEECKDNSIKYYSNEISYSLKKYDNEKDSIINSDTIIKEPVNIISTIKEPVDIISTIKSNSDSTVNLDSTINTDSTINSNSTIIKNNPDQSLLLLSIPKMKVKRFIKEMSDSSIEKEKKLNNIFNSISLLLSSINNNDNWSEDCPNKEVKPLLSNENEENLTSQSFTSGSNSNIQSENHMLENQSYFLEYHLLKLLKTLLDDYFKK